MPESALPRDRLIVPLDVPNVLEAQRLVDELRGSVNFFKVGLELFSSGNGAPFVKHLKRSGYKVFVDLKLFDVPATVARAVERLEELGADLITVHGNQKMMEAAASARRSSKVLAVTALTSLDQGDLIDLGFECSVDELVVSRAKRAADADLDGVVASGREASLLRAALGPRLLIVTPGIRPVENRAEDDQKRVMSPQAAMRSGADYLVIGRPIRNAEDPCAAADRILKEMQKGLDGLDA